MGKTSRDARRHMRELAGLFQISKEVAEAMADELVRRYDKRKYLRQSMKRLIERGLIEKRGKKLVVTQRGERFFKRYIKSSPPTPPKRWDGKWRLVSFDVPVEKNVKRNKLRLLLKEFEFCQLQKSVWACPDFMSQEFWKHVVEEDLEKYCTVMLVEIIEGDEKLRTHFKIPSHKIRKKKNRENKN